MGVNNNLKTGFHRLAGKWITLMATALAVIPLTLQRPTYGQELRSYQITCDSSDFAYILAHPEENIYIDCEFEYDGQTWNDARFRIRGETSRLYPKKSFKVNFDADDRFFERDKMNLVSEWTDPTFSREYLAYDMYQRSGLYASETWFARLYVNGDYIGLYLDVEEIDEHYLRYTLLPDDASIYKADRDGCFLSTTENVDSLWKKRNNEATGFYDLLYLIEWLDTAQDVDFFTGLQDYFDRDELARVIAVNALIGNSSTYYHNYHMVHDIGEGGIWRMLPWDMDKTYDYWGNYVQPNYYRAGNQYWEQTNVLINRCWRDAEMSALILQHMNGLIDSVFLESYYTTVTSQLCSLLYDAVQEDTLKQFTTQNFLDELNLIPTRVTNRINNLTYRIQNAPLPFDFHRAILTPNGVYFSWDSTHIPSGQPLTYTITIGDHFLFNGNNLTIENIADTCHLFSNLQPGVYYWNVGAVKPSGGYLRSISFYHTLRIPENAFRGTVITGNIDSAAVWNLSGSPYCLPEGITVSESGALNIEPGVLVGIGAGRNFIVNGRLTALGTEDDTIRFVPLNPTASPWGAFVTHNPNAEVNLAYTSIIGGSEGPSWPLSPAFFQLEGGRVELLDSHIGLAQLRGIWSLNTDLHLERVNFEHIPLSPVLTKGGSVVIRSCRFARCSGSIFHGLLIDIEDIQTPNSCEISDCRMYYCVDDAIDLDSVETALISRNYITGCDDKGISIGRHSNGIVISNNIVTECSIGVAIKTSSNSTLYNNIIAFNDVGFSAPNESGGGGAVNIYNSILWSNVTRIEPNPQASLTFEHCLIQDEPLYPGAGNLNNDPDFIDVWNNNFVPQEESPLLDAGYGTGHPELDYVYHQRIDIPEIPNTGAGNIPYVDIGVYEYYQGIGGVNPHPEEPPQRHILLTNYPNPFNDATKIEFEMSRSDWVKIKIFNVLGRVVFERKFERLSVGPHSFLWNGRDKNGFSLASGLYFCRLEHRSGYTVRKLTLLK